MSRPILVIDFLRQQKESGKPFDAVLGLKSPHVPRTPPERAKSRFAENVSARCPVWIFTRPDCR